MAKFSWTDELNERQIKEVDFALVYDNSFNHGTAGHNRLLLIAKLAELLDAAYAKLEPTDPELIQKVEDLRTQLERIHADDPQP